MAFIITAIVVNISLTGKKNRRDQRHNNDLLIRSVGRFVHRHDRGRAGDGDDERCRGRRMTLLDVVCPLVALIALGWLVVCLASLRGEK